MRVSLISFTVEFVAFGLFTLKGLRVRAQAGPLYIELELTQQGSGENYSVPKKLRGSYEKILRAVCDTEAYKLCRHWTKPGLIPRRCCREHNFAHYLPPVE